MAAKQVEAQGDFDFQTSMETEIAEWENYTRGIGSKMLLMV
jgi:hypothetical protein